MGAMPTYADPVDYVGWTGGTAPADVMAQLRRASTLVRAATRTAVYAVDSTTSMPTDADTLQAFKNATCEHAATCTAAGVGAFEGGAVAGVASSSIGSASVSTLGYVGGETARLRLSTELCPTAVRILDEVGLIGVPPGVSRG